MFSPLRRWFRNGVARLQARRRTARETDPRAFHRLADDLNALAREAAQFCSREKDTLARVRSVLDDTETISRMASSPEFRKLPPQHRQDLRREMLNSRRELLKSLQSAAAPTRYVQ